VREHHWLGHEDGSCQQVPVARGVAQVARLLRGVVPDTIVTFGPEGMTGHPDHRAVSAWTTLAWEAFGRRSRLLYATLTPAFHAEWGHLNDELGIWAEIDDPPSTPPEELAVSLICRGELLDRKLAALRAHVSQTTGAVEAVGVATYRQWWSGEWFIDATPHASRREEG
jgi:LmbE family N-acetylglucosaminyl deacetylase